MSPDSSKIIDEFIFVDSIDSQMISNARQAFGKLGVSGQTTKIPLQNPKTDNALEVDMKLRITSETFFEI